MAEAGPDRPERGAAMTMQVVKFLIALGLLVPAWTMAAEDAGRAAEAEKALQAADAALKDIKEQRRETTGKGDPGYQAPAARAEAMLEKARERLQEIRDGKATPQFELNQPGNPKARAEGLIARYEETRDPALRLMLPGAYTVLGRFNLAQAGEQETKGNQDQARLAYADTRRNYLIVLDQFPDRKEYQEEALYFAGLCCVKLGDEEAGEKRRAQCFWGDLLRNFPNGTFARQVTQEMKRAGDPSAK